MERRRPFQPGKHRANNQTDFEWFSDPGWRSENRRFGLFRSGSDLHRRREGGDD